MTTPYIQSVGAFRRGIQHDNCGFFTEENFQHLRKNIEQMLSHEYKYPIVLDPQTLEGVMRTYAYLQEPHDKCTLNKRVIQQIKNMFRDDQHDIRIANEWEDEQFNVLARDESTVYNPVPIPIRTEETHPLQFVEM